MTGVCLCTSTTPGVDQAPLCDGGTLDVDLNHHTEYRSDAMRAFIVHGRVVGPILCLVNASDLALAFFLVSVSAAVAPSERMKDLLPPRASLDGLASWRGFTGWRLGGGGGAAVGAGEASGSPVLAWAPGHDDGIGPVRLATAEEMLRQEQRWKGCQGQIRASSRRHWQESMVVAGWLDQVNLLHVNPFRTHDLSIYFVTMLGQSQGHGLVQLSMSPNQPFSLRHVAPFTPSDLSPCLPQYPPSVVFVTQDVCLATNGRDPHFSVFRMNPDGVMQETWHAKPHASFFLHTSCVSPMSLLCAKAMDDNTDASGPSFTVLTLQMCYDTRELVQQTELAHGREALEDFLRQGETLRRSGAPSRDTAPRANANQDDHDAASQLTFLLTLLRCDPAHPDTPITLESRYLCHTPPTQASFDSASGVLCLCTTGPLLDLSPRRRATGHAQGASTAEAHEAHDPAVRPAMPFYTWTQTAREVVVHLTLPPGLSPSSVACQYVSDTHVRLVSRDTAHCILDTTLYAPIDPSNSTLDLPCANDGEARTQAPTQPHRIRLCLVKRQPSPARWLHVWAVDDAVPETVSDADAQHYASCLAKYTQDEDTDPPSIAPDRHAAAAVPCLPTALWDDEGDMGVAEEGDGSADGDVAMTYVHQLPSDGRPGVTYQAMGYRWLGPSFQISEAYDAVPPPKTVSCPSPALRPTRGGSRWFRVEACVVRGHVHALRLPFPRLDAPDTASTSCVYGHFTEPVVAPPGQRRPLTTYPALAYLYATKQRDVKHVVSLQIDGAAALPPRHVVVFVERRRFVYVYDVPRVPGAAHGHSRVVTLPSAVARGVAASEDVVGWACLPSPTAANPGGLLLLVMRRDHQLFHMSL